MRTSSSLRSSYQSRVCDTLLECDYIESPADSHEPEIDASRRISVIEPRVYESRFARVGTNQFVSAVSNSIVRELQRGVNKVVLETLRFDTRTNEDQDVIIQASNSIAQSLSESLAQVGNIDTHFELFLGSEANRDDALRVQQRLKISEKVNALLNRDDVFVSPVLYLERDALTKRDVTHYIDDIRMCRVTRAHGASAFHEEKSSREVHKLLTLVDAYQQEYGYAPDWIISYDERNYRSVRSQGLKRFVKWCNTQPSVNHTSLAHAG